MEKLLQKFRTPIISFCIGVLFSVLSFWIYLEKSSIAQEDDSIIVRTRTSFEDSFINGNGNIKKVYIGGAVVEPQICEVNYEQSLFEQIDNCVEFSDADTEALKLILSANTVNSEYDSFILVSSNIRSEPVVAGASSSDNVISNCININTASTSELDSLPGIGSSYAQRIIESRPYSSKTDIKKVKGIGDKTYEKIESLICL